MDEERWDRVQSLFDAAVNHPTEARLAWLQDACKGDSALLHEVHSLVLADSKATDVFARALSPSDSSSQSPHLAPLKTGQKIAHYDIVDTLGAGGMGVVYKALDTRLDRFVALKLLPSHLNADLHAQQRLMVEAKSACQLDHPNICPVYDLDETSEGQVFIAMKFCPGEGLDQRIARGPLPVLEAVNIARQIADGLSVAHTAGILHRDIKPSNLIVDMEGQVKIVDFGVAKMAGVDLTSSGYRIGTISYMSPEALRAEPVDGRADIWALGAILYEMLTGLQAFAGNHLPQIMYAVINTTPTPLRNLLPSMPLELEKIINRALAREPAYRFNEMGEMLQRLQALLTTLSDTPQAKAEKGPTRLRDSKSAAPASANIATFSGELRQVSVMCVSLHGYAELTNELGLAQSQTVLNRYQHSVIQAVNDLGGSISKTYAHSLMALFGTPVARGNDAERASRAALAVHARIAEVAADIQQPLQVHIGIATGPIVTDTSTAKAMSLLNPDGPAEIENPVSGEAVTIATRLEDMAEPGETLIADGHYRLVNKQFLAHERGALTVRGHAHPISIWSLDGFTTHSAELGPLTGRRAELRLFQGLLVNCLETGQGELLYLRGDAGIGKTRLSEEFVRLAKAQNLSCFTGQILDFGVGEGEDAIGTLVRQFLGLSPDADADTRRQRAQSAKANGDIRNEQSAFLDELLNLPMSPADKILYDAMEPGHRNLGREEALATLLKFACRSGPVLIRVEDLHWADAHLLDCLAALAATALDQPVILVFTARKEHEPLTAAWRARLGDTPLTSIELRPLRRDDAFNLAANFPDSHPEYVERCVTRAEGNPLFLEQLLRNSNHSSNQSDNSASNDTLPPSLHNLVLSQLDRLPNADRQALRAAAVIGQRFSEALVRHLIDEPNYSCEQLLEHGLVRPKNGDYLFSHALIRDGIYLSLLKACKRELHQRAAQWFESSDLQLHAEHLERAENATASDAYQQAASQQVQRFHYERAQRLAERGLHLTPQHPALTCLLGDIQRATGNIDAAQNSYQQVLTQTQDETACCRAWIGHAECCDLADDFNGAMHALQSAEHIAKAQQLTLELARIHYLRGNFYFPRGDINACMQEQEAAQDYAQQAGSAEYEARALSGLGDAHYAAGRMLSAFDVFERCLALCEQHGLGSVEAANRFMLGTVRIYRNESEAALNDALSSAQTAAQVGHIRAEIVSRLTASWVLLDRNEIDEARRQAEQALQLADDLGAKRFQAFLQESLARIALAEGQRDSAHTLATQALVISRDIGMSFIGPWILGTLALTTTDTRQRREALQEGEALLKQGAVGHNYYRFYRAAMESSLANKQWKEAKRYATLLAEYTKDEPPPWSAFFICYTNTLAEIGLNGKTEDKQLAALHQQAQEAGLLVNAEIIERMLVK